jgi:hypothetical protein
LYERIVEEYVVSWFRHISSDEEFSQEIRLLLRDLTTDLLARLAKVAVTALLLTQYCNLVY